MTAGIIERVNDDPGVSWGFRLSEEKLAQLQAASLARARVAADVLMEAHLRDSAFCTWLYFIQAGDNGPIKIGVSQEPLRRLANLQVSNHERLRLLAVARVPFETEADVHEDLAEHRLHGEWFKPEPAVLTEVARQEAKGHRAWLGDGS